MAGSVHNPGSEQKIKIAPHLMQHDGGNADGMGVKCTDWAHCLDQLTVGLAGRDRIQVIDKQGRGPLRLLVCTPVPTEPPGSGPSIN